MEIVLLVYGYNQSTGISDTMSKMYRVVKYNYGKYTFTLESMDDKHLIDIDISDINKVSKFYATDRPEVAVFYGYCNLADINYLMALISTAIKYENAALNREMTIMEKSIKKIYNKLINDKELYD